MKYQVMVRGENFELEINGETQNLGFVTTRWVKAKSIEEAEIQAIQVVKSDTDLTNLMVEDPIETPMVYIEEVAQAKWWKRIGGNGFTFWKMDSE